MGPVNSVPLADHRKNRVLAAIGAFFLSLFAFMWAGLIGVLIQAAWPFGGLAWVGFLMLVAAFIGSALLTWEVARQAYAARGMVHVGDQELIIRHLSLKNPIHIDKTDIHAIAIDSEAARGWWRGVDIELEQSDGERWAGKDPREVGFFADGLTREMYPTITHNQEDVPRANVALVLTRPIDVNELRRYGLLRKELSFAVREADQRELFAILLRVADPDALAVALSRWGIARKLGSGELELLQPSALQRRRFWKRRILALAGMIYGALIVADAIFGDR